MHLPTRIPLLALLTGLTAAFAQTPQPASSTDAEVIQLDRFEVTDVPLEDSINPLTRPVDSILGDARNLIDTPRAATTLTPSLLEQQGIGSLPELAAYAPGTYAPSSYGLLTTPVIRGDTAETYVNGQRLSYNNYGYLPSFNSVEAVDLVRGPGSAVFGAGHQLGGYVNYQTKQPRFDGPHTVLTAHLGTWTSGSGVSKAQGQWQVDHTAPLSEQLAYRLSYEGQTGETFYHRNGVKDDRQDLFAVLTWKPAPDLTVDAQVHTFWQNTPESLGVNRVTQDLIDHGIYQSDSGPVALLRDALLFSRGDYSDAYVGRSQIIITKDVAPDFKIVNRSLYERVDRERYHQFEYVEYVVQDTFENRTEGHWRFSGFGRDQQAILGATLRYEGVDSRVGYSNLAGGDYAFFDITNPSRVFSAASTVSYPYFNQFVGPDGHLVEDAINGNTVRSETWNPSLFWQHDIALAKNLSALIGLREDFYWTKAHDLYLDADTAVDNEGRSTAFDPRDRASVSAFSQSYSLQWRVQPQLAIYATHNRIRSAKGSSTGGGVDLSGGFIDEADFRNQSLLSEIGAKTSLLDHRLFVGVALFHQDRQERDLSGNKNDLDIQGLELESFFQPMTGWTLFANATFQRGRYDDADVFQAGDTLNYYTGVGDWSLVGFSDVLFNGGLRYRFPCGFGAGLNAQWQSEQNVNIATPGYSQMVLPAQARVNGSLFYETERWSATIEVLNLTNKDNWVHNGDAFTGGALISRDLPLRVESNVKLKF